MLCLFDSIFWPMRKNWPSAGLNEGSPIVFLVIWKLGLNWFVYHPGEVSLYNGGSRLSDKGGGGGGGASSRLWDKGEPVSKKIFFFGLKIRGAGPPSPSPKSATALHGLCAFPSWPRLWNLEPGVYICDIAIKLVEEVQWRPTRVLPLPARAKLQWAARTIGFTSVGLPKT